MKRLRSGLALVELLLTLAVLTLLSGFLMAVTAPAKEQARQRVCVSNLHQIGLAVSMYRSDYGGLDPVEGQPLRYSELGLPSGKMLPAFVSTYIPTRQRLLCPDYHGRIPVPNLLATYAWVPDDDQFHSEIDKYSSIVAVRCLKTPVMTDDQHNPFIDASLAPRWERKRVLVLRLGGQVDALDVSVRTVDSEW